MSCLLVTFYTLVGAIIHSSDIPIDEEISKVATYYPLF